jgi:hypothetical protein
MTFLYHPRPERWPQVSLRGFFVLVTVAGVLCWVGVQLKWISDRNEWLEHSRYAGRPGPAPFVLETFGESGWSRLELLAEPTQVSPAAIQAIRALFPEATIGFRRYGLINRESRPRSAPEL